MRAAIYARKSTGQDDVADDAKSVTRQITGARAFIAKRGWTVHDDHVYTDDGVSGALFESRPAFQRLMLDAAAGAFDAVVFFDIDRFGRDGWLTYKKLHELADLGVSVWDFSTGREVDLNSFEGRVTTSLRAEFAAQFRDQIRKHTRAAMRQKAAQGYVTGGEVFGYDNVRVSKGHVERRINESQAAIVREIYTRFAAGEGARTIAGALNRQGVASPRAQQGRPSGWSASTIRAVLQRPLYRGTIVYGRQGKGYGRRELGRGARREKGMVDRPESTWLRVAAPALRIIDADLAARCDERRIDRRTRYLASVAAGGHVALRAHGKYLLSGGLLVCPTCGGHFEARLTPWRGVANVYICATRRRKPGVCGNTLALPIDKTDDAVLSVVGGEVLGTSFINELLSVVDTGAADLTSQHAAERERLQREIGNLMDLVASGIPADTIAPKIRERQTALAKVETALRSVRKAPPNIERLRAALEQRAAEWRADLRTEPKVARLLLRRLVGPITLSDPSDFSAFLEWEASLKPGLIEGLEGLEGLVHDGASPTGFEPVFWP